MSAIEPFYKMLKIDISKLSREEIFLLEADLFARICNELTEFFRTKYQDYFKFMKYNKPMEDKMLEINFLRFILNDILSTKDYTLSGIAHYSNAHEDVVQEIIDGRNRNPSAILLRRGIDLHRSVRRDLYHSIIKKISVEYSAIKNKKGNKET